MYQVTRIYTGVNPPMDYNRQQRYLSSVLELLAEFQPTVRQSEGRTCFTTVYVKRPVINGPNDAFKIGARTFKSALDGRIWEV
jgi:hypothetical protein